MGLQPRLAEAAEVSKHIYEFALNGDYSIEIVPGFQEFSVKIQRWNDTGSFVHHYPLLAALGSSVPQTRLKTILNKYKLRTGLNQTLNSIQLYPIYRISSVVTVKLQIFRVGRRVHQ